mgnify:CR=1 FL=1
MKLFGCLLAFIGLIMLFGTQQDQALIYLGISIIIAGSIFIIFGLRKRTVVNNEPHIVRNDASNNSYEWREPVRSNPTDNRIGSKQELIRILVDMYYEGIEHQSLVVTFRITPNDVIDIFSDVHMFPFQPSVHCKVSPDENKKMYDDVNIVEIKLQFTQGNRLFLSVIRPGQYDNLSPEDRQVSEKLAFIIGNTISSKMSSLEKAKRIHDYLISTSEYDDEIFKRDTIPATSYTPYGLLFNHRAVCQAYAETYMVMMTMIDIECHIVVGNLLSTKDINTSNHAWNIIKINGKYGHVDVTSDNPTPKVIGRISNQYFYVNDEYMDRTHKWLLINYPICD